jgi:hypothetical protein
MIQGGTECECILPVAKRVNSDWGAKGECVARVGAGRHHHAGGDLYFGNAKVSPDSIDAVAIDAVLKKLGGEASVFVKSGDQYVRVATTLKKEDGTNAVGTALDANNPAVAKLNSGEPYYGDATVFGQTYDAGYEPIIDASGAVIGAYFVGNKK